MVTKQRVWVGVAVMVSWLLPAGLQAMELSKQKPYDAEPVGSPWTMVPGYADLCYRELTGDSLRLFLVETRYRHMGLFREQWQKIVEVISLSKISNNIPRLLMYLFYQDVADQEYKNALVHHTSQAYELLEQPHGDTEFCYKDDLVRAHKAYQEYIKGKKS